MPKSKVRRKASTTTSRSATAAVANAGPRVKVAGPSSPLFIGVMVGLMLLGLLWLVLYYLWPTLPLLSALGNWNFGVGFALMIAGLLMTMKWR